MSSEGGSPVGVDKDDEVCYIDKSIYKSLYKCQKKPNIWYIYIVVYIGIMSIDRCRFLWWSTYPHLKNHKKILAKIFSPYGK
jgi:hypothetical protein